MSDASSLIGAGLTLVELLTQAGPQDSASPAEVDRLVTEVAKGAAEIVPFDSPCPAPTSAPWGSSPRATPAPRTGSCGR